MCLDAYTFGGNDKLVTLCPQLLVFAELEANRAALTHGGRDIAREAREVLSHVLQYGIVITDTVKLVPLQFSFSGLPVLYGWNNEGFLLSKYSYAHQKGKN